MTQEIIFMELSSSSNLILAGFNCIITILPLPAYRIWNFHIFFSCRLLLFVLKALYMIGYISNENLDSLAIKTEVKARFSFFGPNFVTKMLEPQFGGGPGGEQSYDFSYSLYTEGCNKHFLNSGQCWTKNSCLLKNWLNLTKG